ncbi:hypothetical protein GGI25_003294 [Coemansia spiralis]|uniref:Arrestin C-terminal-like domain-containing protein n=2 Tax=Coemansia TaxID=4863 RepID=A0A9W8G276_9FUNG|nr:hypothetical protein EDC05_002602 [Coemansia umbellata]KAJ2622525.1 hypothetical protein GGI26_003124 [Coemansia sp. RSA 1358]KAJ2677074.1 hypothetical protein GGI25_003294 [Coemansia spiralis]
MRSGPSLEIVLDKPELLVRGSFDEAAPVLLSGKLVVHIHEPLRARSLRLVFTGRIDTFLSQNLINTKDEHREIVRREWVFLEPQRPPTVWGSKRVFDFEMLVPGDNPETIVTALGRVRYQLHATLERPSFHANLTTSTDVHVKRGPMAGAPWALALMESIEATGDWNEQLDYRVSVPTRSLKDGEVFTTRFELEPRAKGLKLVAVGVLVKEYARYYSSTGEPLHRFSRVVARNENYISPAGICGVEPRRADDCLDLVEATSVQIPLAVPNAYGAIQYDVLTDVIEVRHRIKFLIKVRDTNMLIHSIFIAVPVSIMPVNARDDSSILPRYEAALSGPVIMRSGTQPPSYDAIDDARVEPGATVNGFPGPLHRSRSQFYLASPDHSPELHPADSPTMESAQALQGSDADSALPQRLSQSTNRSSTIGSRHTRTSSLHELFGNKLSDKVRSIFHSRTASGSRNMHEGDKEPGVRALTPPPPSRTRAETVGVRRSSVQPMCSPDGHRGAEVPLFGGRCSLGNEVDAVSGRPVIRPPPGVLIHDKHTSPHPPGTTPPLVIN